MLRIKFPTPAFALSAAAGDARFVFVLSAADQKSATVVMNEELTPRVKQNQFGLIEAVDVSELGARDAILIMPA